MPLSFINWATPLRQFLQKNIAIKMEMGCRYSPDTCIEHNILYLLRTNLEHILKMVADLELHTQLDQYPSELGLKVMQRRQGKADNN